jgi:DNA (cytosine-5)-methyltransferase 1
VSYAPTHLDLFSGIGGFSIAAERCGFQTIGFSELDPYASAVLKCHWPTVHNYGDIRNIVGGGMHVDLLTGGFPCQPFSVAGKKRGDSDERFLWPELLRVLGEVRPTFALFENVPGLLSIDGGRTFNRILSDISSLGYDCLWNLVPACAVGANHQRDRLWIVAYSHASRQRRNERENKTQANALADSRLQRSTECKEQTTGTQQCGEVMANPGLQCEGIKERGGNAEGAPSQSSGCRETLANSSEQHRTLKGQEASQFGWGSKIESNNRNAHCDHESKVEKVSGRKNAQSGGVSSISNTKSDARRFSNGDSQENGNQWSVEPDVGRVAHGIPKRVDRLRCLGNAIVPQVAEIFLKEMRRFF